MISAECPLDKACVKSRCQDPCPGTCGLNSRCQVVNHNPICSCSAGFTGDPFTRCEKEERKHLILTVTIPNPVTCKLLACTFLAIVAVTTPQNPCIPSPCGPNSQCRVIGNTPACSCLPNYIGRAPNCRPECTISAECPSNKACQREKCVDPCPGSCGANTECSVINHSPVCSCQVGFTGDPFGGCSSVPSKKKTIEEFCSSSTTQFLVTPNIVEPINPCNPSPCGANAICKEHNGAGSCTCLPEYFGDPYTGCRPECVTNSDCSQDKACSNNKCRDPCPGTCGFNADCFVNNHSPSCNCLPGFTGNPLTSCHQLPSSKFGPYNQSNFFLNYQP